SSAICPVIRACVKDLDDVDQSCQILDRILAEVPAELIVWVFEIHEPSLLLDLDYCLLRGKTRRNPSLEEQADKFAVGRRDLLPDHNSLPDGRLEPNSGDGSVVIGQENGIEPELSASVRNTFWLAFRVERRRAMDV